MSNSPTGVQLSTLELLEQTLAYLQRLPAVPATTELVREIEDHLASPEVAEARRSVAERELLATKRVARMYGPSGSVRYEVLIEGAKVTIKVPRTGDPYLLKDKRMSMLARGVTMDLLPVDKAGKL